MQDTKLQARLERNFQDCVVIGRELRMGRRELPPIPDSPPRFEPYVITAAVDLTNDQVDEIQAAWARKTKPTTPFVVRET